LRTRHHQATRQARHGICNLLQSKWVSSVMSNLIVKQDVTHGGWLAGIPADDAAQPKNRTDIRQ
jgi:hypothetical protein